MRFKKFRGFLCLFHVVLCAMVFNQQSFAGTWTDAFEDDNTQEWELFNTFDEEEAKWWIDRGEAVAETFEPHHDFPTVWSTGELDWRNYSLSCKAKLVEAKAEPASLRTYTPPEMGGILLLCMSDSLPMGDRPYYKVYRQSINTR